MIRADRQTGHNQRMFVFFFMLLLLFTHAREQVVVPFFVSVSCCVFLSRALVFRIPVPYTQPPT